jgi:integrase
MHDLGHTFGQRLRDAGVSAEDRALLLGHAIARPVAGSKERRNEKSRKHN